MATQTHRTVPAAGAAFLSDLQTFLRSEDADRYSDLFTGCVVSGGTHSTVAGLTGTPTALVAYPGGYYTTESGSITYDDAKTQWVVAHSDTTGDLGTFTRVPGTHYLLDTTSGASQPSLPSGTVWLMKVVAAGGAVTAVTDLRRLVPLDITPPSYLYANLPTSEVGLGDLAVVTDRGNALFMHDGTAWRPVSVLAESFAQASLPAAGVAGRLRRVSDNTRGLYMDTGAQWFDLNRRVRNVAAANVTADGATDDYTAFQTVLDEVAAQVELGQYYIRTDEIAMPPGLIKHSQPLVLKGRGFTLRGAGKYRTALQATYAGPGVVVVGNAPLAIPTQASLATGAGVAYSLGNHRFNLRDCASINGLAAMTVEFFVAPTGGHGGAARVWMDSRAYLPGMNIPGDDEFGIQIGAEAALTITARMTVGGTMYTVTSTSTIADNGTVYHLAVTYDGTNIKLWFNGTLEDTQATGGGTVTQTPNQAWTIGRNAYFMPESDNINVCGTGAIDSIRVSNVARYTGNFTAPTAKFTDDANTVLLCNFDNIVKNILVECDVITGSYTKGWMLFRDLATLTTAAPYSHLAEFTTLAYGGIIAHNAWRSRFDALEIVGARGLLLLADCWESRVTALECYGVNAGDSYGFGANKAAALYVEHPILIGFAHQMVLHYAGGTIVNPWFQTESNTLTCLTSSNASEDSAQLTVISPWCNTESGGAGVLRLMSFSDEPALVLEGGLLENTGVTTPSISVTNGTNLTVLGTRFRPKAATTSIFDVYAGTPNVALLNASKTEAAVPWGVPVHTYGETNISGLALSNTAPNSQALNVQSLTELHTLAAAGTSDTTIEAPAGALVLGVSWRVTTLITGCTTFDVGTAAAATKYGTLQALAAGTTGGSAGTTNPDVFAAATKVRFTAVGGGAAFTAGVIRVTVYYLDLTAPTS